jgi:peptidylamidoglycolate lyase
MKTSLLTICFWLSLAFTVLAQAAAPNDNYMVDTEWAQLPAGMEWGASTSNVAADGKGQVLVFVRTAPYFRFFNRDGSFIRAWGDAELFNNPHSAIFDEAGDIWTTDSDDQLVRKFTADGKLLMTIGKKGVIGDNSSTDSFNGANAVAIASNGDIYVSDGYENARIVHFNSDGEFIRIIGGGEGSEPGQLKVVHGVAIDSNGRILVNDSDNQRVSVFDSDGKFVETWPVPSRGVSVMTADDTVYISDVNAGSISIVKDGRLIDTIPVPGRPHGLSLDSDGTMYVSDSSNRVIMKITPKN